MAQCLAAADLVICRAGPLPSANWRQPDGLPSSSHRPMWRPITNTTTPWFWQSGAAILIEEKDLAGELLCQRSGSWWMIPGGCGSWVKCPAPCYPGCKPADLPGNYGAFGPLIPFSPFALCRHTLLLQERFSTKPFLTA